MNERRLPGVAVLLAAMLVAGCASRERAARDTFAERFTCPIERVTATKVDGVRRSEVLERATPIPDPPAEIRADPARLAQWTDSLRVSPGFDGYYEGYRAAGCGHRAEYLCTCPIEAPIAKQAACTCEAPSVPLLSDGMQGERE
ncbi:hypothetical protein MNQ96_00180 [Sphingopyxis granuli]|uniref:hypothetical protein n=1 Tax=Sphingopyxis granuli TaxID=267128 RepID=UPI001F534E89|nr:hypothetical protein [Sphingopyxis granuli]UNK79554.1 hypothetical protein MNQ96_00180 [Sphingopyxis granuli]